MNFLVTNGLVQKLKFAAQNSVLSKAFVVWFGLFVCFICLFGWLVGLLVVCLLVCLLRCMCG
jgi:hypothetical protein